jgi:hypothetical protein
VYSAPLGSLSRVGANTKADVDVLLSWVTVIENSEPFADDVMLFVAAHASDAMLVNVPVFVRPRKSIVPATPPSKSCVGEF